MVKFSSEIINPGTAWQIGTGDDTRMYYDIFLKCGVALVGPGYPGKEGEKSTSEFYKKHPSTNNWGALLTKVKKGQWLIARKGKSFILGVGEVIEEYNYSDLFSDIEGWDLQHYVKVKWYIPNNESKKLQLSSYCLGQSTLQGCNVQDVYNAIYEAEFEEYKSQLIIETVNDKRLEIKDIVESLIEHGIRIQDAENIGVTLQRIIRLTNYYVSYNYGVSEAEIITFLIVPTLIALGWSEQKIKLQIKYIDVAVFKDAYADDYEQNPEIIIEAKKFDNGLAFTTEQISTYAKYYSNCKKFITTNGFRYRYFEMEENELICKGYFNLIDLKAIESLRGYPLSAIETILSISNFK